MMENNMSILFRTTSNEMINTNNHPISIKVDPYFKKLTEEIQALIRLNADVQKTIPQVTKLIFNMFEKNPLFKEKIVEVVKNGY